MRTLRQGTQGLHFPGKKEKTLKTLSALDKKTLSTRLAIKVRQQDQMSKRDRTIDRVADVYPADEKSMVRSMLSESIQAVISQTLLKKVGGGRVAAHEIMVGTNAIRNLIREDKIAQMYSMIQTGQNDGMQTLDQCREGLLRDRLITASDARMRAVDKSKFL